VAQRLNKFIDRLESGVVSCGEIIHPDVRLAQRLGDSDLDWVWFATEHDELNFRLLSDCLAHMISRPQIRVTREVVSGPAPMIGLPAHAGKRNPWMVTQALDLGFMVVHQARVQTPEDVAALVAAARYPIGASGTGPPGTRGYGPMGAPRYWGCTDVPEYLQKADVWPLNPDGEILLLVTVEDAAGLDRVEDIVKVPGLGGIILGTSDITIAKFGPLGLGSTSEWLAEAEARVRKAARNAGIAVGTAALASEAALAKAVDEGYTFVISRGENYLPLNLHEQRIALPLEQRAVRPVHE
jgi:4-hydroxy-2-oxoheptanedioate aldolase